MKRFGLLGERLSHSFSPLIHSKLGDYEYKLFEKTPDEVEDFVMRGDFDGLNVTIPYKQAVMRYCRSLSDVAKRIGSVNTLVRTPDGGLHGDNTDYCGFAYLLESAGVGEKLRHCEGACDRSNPEKPCTYVPSGLLRYARNDGGRDCPTVSADKKILILGSGGSSLTVRAVLGDMGMSGVHVISRRGGDNYANIARHSDAKLIINTTPVGMYPNNWDPPLVDLAIFPECEAVVDLVYNPIRTELIMQAGERGIRAANGLPMLVKQAARAAEIFAENPVSDEKIESVTADLERQTRNIVLIGMPGCGKTSIGAALAGKMGRPFADTDEHIEKATGKPIPAIIAEDGEDAFRELETEALRELCKQNGLVVATGGGAVKRPMNRRIIRQNGLIVFLDRELGELSVSGRPLSQQTGVETLAAERLPLYREWADLTVSVRGIEQTATDILEKI